MPGWPQLQGQIRGVEAASTKLLLRPRVLLPVWSFRMKDSHLGFFTANVGNEVRRGSPVYKAEHSVSLQALSGGEKRQENPFPCIFKQKEQAVKGTPSLHSHSCSSSTASRDQLVLSEVFLGNTPNIFTLKENTLPSKAHQALRAPRLNPTTGGSLELLSMPRGSSSCQP